LLAEFTTLCDIAAFCIRNNVALQHTGKKGSAFKNATGVKIKKASADAQLLKAKAVRNWGWGAELAFSSHAHRLL